MQSNYLQGIMKKTGLWAKNKANPKPIQSQNKPNSKRNAPLHKQRDLLQLESGFVMGRLKSLLANQTESVI